MLSQTCRQTHCYAGSPTKFGILAAFGWWSLEKACRILCHLATPGQCDSPAFGAPSRG